MTRAAAKLEALVTVNLIAVEKAGATTTIGAALSGWRFAGTGLLVAGIFLVRKR